MDLEVAVSEIADIFKEIQDGRWKILSEDVMVLLARPTIGHGLLFYMHIS